MPGLEAEHIRISRDLQRLISLHPPKLSLPHATLPTKFPAIAQQVLLFQRPRLCKVKPLQLTTLPATAPLLYCSPKKCYGRTQSLKVMVFFTELYVDHPELLICPWGVCVEYDVHATHSQLPTVLPWGSEFQWEVTRALSASDSQLHAAYR